MEDVAPELLKRIRTEFSSAVEQSGKLKAIEEKIFKGTATYAEANEYAIEAGRLLAGAYKNNISAAVLPDGKMYYNIADRVIGQTMKEDYQIISDVSAQIQKSLNEAAGIGINAIVPEMNTDRVMGIINRVSTAEKYNDVAWILQEPVVNFSQSIVDDTIKVNSEFHAEAGLTAKIVRKLAGGCCKWCSSLAGTYVYPDVPKDVYRRHENCRCTVDYTPEKGRKSQNVCTKKWKTAEEYDKIEKRKQIGLSQNISGIRTINKKVDQDERFVIQPDKINKFLLKPGAKHSKEFFDVGYSSDDHVKLYKDIAAQFDMEKAEYDEKSKFGQGFSIDMQLGITKKRTFKTVWQIEKEGDKPRLITAHRRR